MVVPFKLDARRQSAGPPPPPLHPDRHAARSHRRRHRRRLVLLLVMLLVLVGAGAFVGVRLRQPDPVPTVTPVLARTVAVPAASVALPWPLTGQAAVAVPAAGINLASGPEQPVPVASLTKLMTAYVILHDHPLALHQAGPTITVSPLDVQDYDNDTVNDNSNALVVAGEQLTEQQVLAGLLVHSADNYADLLARWDAGSIAGFVAKMNADAASLGMQGSHFADASGIDPRSQSTASDILKVAAKDMANPAFASMVKMSSVTLPEAGTISSYTPLLGLAGIIGVKSGFTTAAGGCDVLGVVRPVDGHPVLLLAAVTGQTGPVVLAQAGLHGLALVNAMSSVVSVTPVLATGRVAAHVSEAGATVDARTAGSVSLVTWPGVRAGRVFHRAPHLTDQARRGSRIGTMVVTLGDQRVSVPVRLDEDVPQPTLLQRLF
jgi:D-alanyl-D-alanine carboxypeptidase (penicillin-binding protein 5/6)